MNSQGLAEDTVCALKQTKILSFTNKEPIKNMNSQDLAEDTVCALLSVRSRSHQRAICHHH